MKPIELYDISRYRKPLMGMSILFIMLFHTQMDRIYFMSYISRCGSVGVDMFLFLSGIGLWFSWTKNPSIHQFFYRRFWRIYPEYFIVACLFYIPDFMRIQPVESHNWYQFLSNILVNLCFWTNGERTFWYIPAIMALYLIAPFYMKLIRHNPYYQWLPVLVILFGVFMQYNIMLRHTLGHLEIFLFRIPIFLIGLNCGKMVKDNIKMPPSTYILIILIFIASSMICVTSSMSISSKYPILLIRLTFIPLSISLTLLLIPLLSHISRYLMSVISLLGSISMELYLIHGNFVLPRIEELNLGYCLTALISITIACLPAWFLYRLHHLNIWKKALPSSTNKATLEDNHKK